MESNSLAKELDYPRRANAVRASQLSALLKMSPNGLTFQRAITQQDFGNRLRRTGLATQGLQGLTQLATANLTGTANAANVADIPRQQGSTTTTSPGLGLLGQRGLAGIGSAIGTKLGSAALPGAIIGGTSGLVIFAEGCGDGENPGPGPGPGPGCDPATDPDGCTSCGISTCDDGLPPLPDCTCPDTCPVSTSCP